MKAFFIVIINEEKCYNYYLIREVFSDDYLIMIIIIVGNFKCGYYLSYFVSNFEFSGYYFNGFINFGFDIDFISSFSCYINFVSVIFSS